VIEVETSLEPRDVLAACKTVERELGRAPGGRRHAPRPIDIDLLLLGDLHLDEEGLVIPHPGIAHRRFVQVPLLELDQGLDLPGALAGEDQRLTRIGSLQE
jgi:2-amino-4-hydroxy-6-hydroxymethyldihydropteridine diphosphokinase